VEGGRKRELVTFKLAPLLCLSRPSRPSRPSRLSHLSRLSPLSRLSSLLSTPYFLLFPSQVRIAEEKAKDIERCRLAWDTCTNGTSTHLKDVTREPRLTLFQGKDDRFTPSTPTSNTTTTTTTNNNNNNNATNNTRGEEGETAASDAAAPRGEETSLDRLNICSLAFSACKAEVACKLYGVKGGGTSGAGGGGGGGGGGGAGCTSGRGGTKYVKVALKGEDHQVDDPDALRGGGKEDGPYSVGVRIGV
jgi:hypothetical protein